MVSYTVASVVNLGWFSLGGQPSLRPLLESEASGRYASVSPDGKWLAYASTETGSLEVWVQRFPEGGSRQRISSGGGGKPLWDPDGDALYYVAGGMMMVVPLTLEPTLTFEAPRMLFEPETNTLLDHTSRGIQDVSPDGRPRFLAALDPESPVAMSLEPSAAIGSYTITAKIGAGGMGEV